MQEFVKSCWGVSQWACTLGWAWMRRPFGMLRVILVACGQLDTGISFYGVETLFWYFLCLNSFGNSFAIWYISCLYRIVSLVVKWMFGKTSTKPRNFMKKIVGALGFVFTGPPKPASDLLKIFKRYLKGKIVHRKAHLFCILIKCIEIS